MKKDLGGQMRFDGSQMPAKKPLPKPPVPKEPIKAKHRVFNYTPNIKHLLPADQFVEKDWPKGSEP